MTSEVAAKRGRLRKAVLGDWHPLLRDPLDLLRLSFVAGAVVFLLRGDVEPAVTLAAAFLVLMLAKSLRMPRLFDLLFIIGLGSSAWGNALNLFDEIDKWDNLVHFIFPMSSVPVLYVLCLRLGLVPDLAETRRPRQRLGLIMFAQMSGLSIAALYEIYEYVVVNWFGSDKEIGYSDTIFDLTLGAGGALAGGLILMLWSAAHWPSERRPLM